MVVLEWWRDLMWGGVPPVRGVEWTGFGRPATPLTEPGVGSPGMSIVVSAPNGEKGTARSTFTGSSWGPWGSKQAK